MIKIIKPGNPQPMLYQGTCKHCHGMIQAEKEDFVFEDRPCGTGYVKCPTANCPGQIDIETCLKINDSIIVREGKT